MRVSSGLDAYRDCDLRDTIFREGAQNRGQGSEELVPASPTG
jgi:hypothetical protein